MTAPVRNTLLLLLVSLAARTVFASDATSFFAYLREHSVEAPESVEEKSSGDREGRQITNSPGVALSFAIGPANGFAVNGVSNFTLNFNLPTNFAVNCGGDPLNYCNYPDLPLIETYDLNYYARRPIPSGRCPQGYTKMQTFDCLNIAPALFETTCCVYSATTTDTSLTDTTMINAFFCLCNNTCYIITAAGAVYGFNVNSAGSATPVSGPLTLAAFTGGCGTSGSNIAEAETLSNCNVIFYTFSDTFFIVDFFSTGSPTCSATTQIDTLIGTPGTPQVAYTLFRGGPLITQIDQLPNNPVLFTVTLLSAPVSAATTTSIATSANPGTTVNDQQFTFTNDPFLYATVTPPLLLRSIPFTNASAASFVPNLDALAFIINTGAGNQICFVNRQGTLLNGATATASTTVTGAFTLAGCRAFCSGFGACLGTSSTSGTVVAPLVYIPYPIYPVFTGQQTNG